MAKKVDFDKVAQGLFKRTEDYADKVRKHYVTAVDELLKLAAMYHPDGTSAAFSFADNTRLSSKANDILRQLYAAVYGEIQNGVKAEWQYANVSCDALIEELFGKGLKEDNHFARWFSRNQEAMDSFLKRKSGPGGLNLSRKIWKYIGDFRTEMETAISLSMGAGDSASTMSRKVRQYLEHPDDMFRRFRVKVGEQPLLDEQGNPILDDKGNPMTEPVYGRRWKKKVIDPQTGAVTWMDFDPRDYHTGRGVYRSSYKNAMRLTRTETNMAYRTAEQDRWQRLDFVVGYEVRTSNNHPDEDICDILKGRYPKNFTFRGWHPQCRCYCVPILATEEEFLNQQRMILDGEKDIPAGSVNEVTRLPKNFTDWIDDNKDRIEEAEARGTLPYFITDNKRKKFNSQPLPIATNPDVLDLSKPKHQVKYQTAKNVLATALNYPELDTSALTAYLSAGTSVTSIVDETKALAQKILAVKKDEKYLSALIPDVHNWKTQFTSSELHAVYDAVEKSLATFPADMLERREMVVSAIEQWGLPGQRFRYRTCDVTKSAYQLELRKIDNLLRIHKGKFGEAAAYAEDVVEALAFANVTKSPQYKALAKEIGEMIAEPNISIDKLREKAQDLIDSFKIRFGRAERKEIEAIQKQLGIDPKEHSSWVKDMLSEEKKNKKRKKYIIDEQTLTLRGTSDDFTIVTRRDGIIIRKSKTVGEQHYTYKDFQKPLSSLPVELRCTITHIDLVGWDNPDDDYWRKVYTKSGRPFGRSWATGGNGTVTFYANDKDSAKANDPKATLSHECGHNLDRKYGAKLKSTTGYFSDDTMWQTAMAEDKKLSGLEAVTTYGLNSPHEDFADSCKLFVDNEPAFRRKFPNRYKIIKAMLHRY